MRHFSRRGTATETLAADFPAVPEYRLEIGRRSHKNLASVLLGLHQTMEEANAGYAEESQYATTGFSLSHTRENWPLEFPS